MEDGMYVTAHSIHPDTNGSKGVFMSVNEFAFGGLWAHWLHFIGVCQMRLCLSARWNDSPPAVTVGHTCVGDGCCWNIATQFQLWIALGCLQKLG